MKLSKQEAVVEAVLFAAGDSVTIKDMSTALNVDETTARDIALSLKQKYENEKRGIRIIEVEDSFQMCTNLEYFKNIKDIYEAPRKKQLSPAVLETLAIIAYKQPVTRSVIEEIRGVNSDKAINKLIEYNLVTEKGRLDVVGKPIIFGTTDEFLKYFGFTNLNGLPEVSEVNKEDVLNELEEAKQ